MADNTSALQDFYGDLTDNGGETDNDAVYPRKGAGAPPRRRGQEHQLGSSSDAQRQRAATLDNRSANRGRPNPPGAPSPRSTRPGNSE